MKIKFLTLSLLSILMIGLMSSCKEPSFQKQADKTFQDQANTLGKIVTNVSDEKLTIYVPEKYTSIYSKVFIKSLKYDVSKAEGFKGEALTEAESKELDKELKSPISGRTALYPWEQPGWTDGPCYSTYGCGCTPEMNAFLQGQSPAQCCRCYLNGASGHCLLYVSTSCGAA